MGEKYFWIGDILGFWAQLGGPCMPGIRNGVDAVRSILTPAND